MNKSDIDKPSYPTFSEYRRKEFLNIVTAVGIGVSAAALPLSAICKDKPASESKTDKTTESTKVQGQIILLAANLGHKDFKEREKATQLLVTMGKKFQKEKKVDLTQILKSELEKSNKSKDPEVKRRAKMILLALTPKPPKRPNIPRRMGAMVAPIR